MPDRKKVFDALRNCITEPKCRDCPWEDCERFNCKRVDVPVSLMLDVLKLLKEQEEVEATINEDYEIFCGNCGENVGIIGRSVNLKICSNYCSNCGKKVKRPMEWYET